MNISDLNLKDWEYQTDEVLLLPLNSQFKHLFPSSLLPRLHARLAEERLLEIIFAGMPSRNNEEQWCAYMSKCPIVLFIEKPDKIIGAGWITQSEGTETLKKMAFGFWLFRSAWGTRNVRDICRFSLRWWFEELNALVLYATSLKTNRLAVNFSRNFHFTRLCDLPMFFIEDGRLVDGTLICLKREDFRRVYEAWKSGQAVSKPSGNRVNGRVHLQPEV